MRLCSQWWPRLRTRGSFNCQTGSKTLMPFFLRLHFNNYFCDSSSITKCFKTVLLITAIRPNFHVSAWIWKLCFLCSIINIVYSILATSTLQSVLLWRLIKASKLNLWKHPHSQQYVISQWALLAFMIYPLPAFLAARFALRWKWRACLQTSVYTTQAVVGMGSPWEVYTRRKASGKIKYM